MTLAAALRSANPPVGSWRCTRAWARLPKKPTCFTESSTGGGAHGWAVLVLPLLSCLASPAGRPVPVPACVAGDGAEPVPVAGDASEPEAAAGDASEPEAVAGDAWHSEAGLLWGAEVAAGLEAVGAERFDREAEAGADDGKWV